VGGARRASDVGNATEATMLGDAICVLEPASEGAFEMFSRIHHRASD